MLKAPGGRYVIKYHSVQFLLAAFIPRSPDKTLNNNSFPWLQFNKMG